MTLAANQAGTKYRALVNRLEGYGAFCEFELHCRAYRPSHPGRGSMGSKSKVVAYTSRAIHANTTDVKLDNIARAIAELADFVDDLEDKLRRIDSKLK
jgi:hypothetical protein